MSGSQRPPAWRADLALVAVCAVWGVTFILVKQAVADISVLLFLTIRFTLATALLALLFGFRKNRPPLRPSLRGGIMAGCFLFTGYVLQTFGLRHTTASKTGFITGLYIPLVPLLGALVYRKAPQVSEAIGIVFAFAGMALLTIQGDILSIGKGDILVACAAVSYAFHILVLARYSKTADVGWIAITQIATAATLGWLTFWWAEPVAVQWTRSVVLALGVTSVLATAFAFWALTWAQKYTTAARTALILSLEPVFAWLASYIAAGEVLNGRSFAGAALILAGIVFAELKPFGMGVHQPLSDESG
jgi:drug/metabolite transporter (DMT)-like permease